MDTGVSYNGDSYAVLSLLSPMRIVYMIKSPRLLISEVEHSETGEMSSYGHKIHNDRGKSSA